MTDQELTELAAKAVGGYHDFTWVDTPFYSGLMRRNFDAPEDGGLEVQTSDWAPLEDECDAFRLAVRLNLLILPYPDDKAVRVTRLDQPDTIVSWGTPPDPYAATRRAIVRAAAEIGKAKL